jgi:hypothetical protein
VCAPCVFAGKKRTIEEASGGNSHNSSSSAAVSGTKHARDDSNGALHGAVNVADVMKKAQKLLSRAAPVNGADHEDVKSSAAVPAAVSTAGDAKKARIGEKPLNEQNGAIPAQAETAAKAGAGKPTQATSTAKSSSSNATGLGAGDTRGLMKQALEKMSAPLGTATSSSAQKVTLSEPVPSAITPAGPSSVATHSAVTAACSAVPARDPVTQLGNGRSTLPVSGPSASAPGIVAQLAPAKAIKKKQIIPEEAVVSPDAKRAEEAPQAAATGLEPGEIAQPSSSTFRGSGSVAVPAQVVPQSASHGAHREARREVQKEPPKESNGGARSEPVQDDLEACRYCRGKAKLSKCHNNLHLNGKLIRIARSASAPSSASIPSAVSQQPPPPQAARPPVQAKPPQNPRGPTAQPPPQDTTSARAGVNSDAPTGNTINATCSGAAAGGSAGNGATTAVQACAPAGIAASGVDRDSRDALADIQAQLLDAEEDKLVAKIKGKDQVSEHKNYLKHSSSAVHHNDPGAPEDAGASADRAADYLNTLTSVNKPGWGGLTPAVIARSTKPAPTASGSSGAEPVVAGLVKLGGRESDPKKRLEQTTMRSAGVYLPSNAYAGDGEGPSPRGTVPPPLRTLYKHDRAARPAKSILTGGTADQKNTEQPPPVSADAAPVLPRALRKVMWPDVSLHKPLFSSLLFYADAPIGESED